MHGVLIDPTRLITNNTRFLSSLCRLDGNLALSDTEIQFYLTESMCEVIIDIFKQNLFLKK